MTFISQISEIKKEADRIFNGRAGRYNHQTPLEEYFLHGPQDCIYEVYKKILRIENMVQTGPNKNREECLDSVYDIINYTAILGALLNEDCNYLPHPSSGEVREDVIPVSSRIKSVDS